MQTGRVTVMSLENVSLSTTSLVHQVFLIAILLLLFQIVNKAYSPHIARLIHNLQRERETPAPWSRHGSSKSFTNKSLSMCPKSDTLLGMLRLQTVFQDVMGLVLLRWSCRLADKDRSFKLKLNSESKTAVNDIEIAETGRQVNSVGNVILHCSHAQPPYLLVYR